MEEAEAVQSVPEVADPEKSRVTITSDVVATESVAVIVDVPPVSEIEIGDADKVTSGVITTGASSSAIVIVCCCVVASVAFVTEVISIYFQWRTICVFIRQIWDNGWFQRLGRHQLSFLFCQPLFIQVNFQVNAIFLVQ